MGGIKEYSYLYKDKNIIIKIGKRSNELGETVYFAKANYKKIIAFAECREKALENCIKKIKFSTALLEKKIELIEQEKAINFAKKFFEENFLNRELIYRYKDSLSYSIFVEDDLLTLNVIISDVKIMNTIAIIYVNLITGECDMIENRFVTVSSC